jgi:hypothetical protein
MPGRSVGELIWMLSHTHKVFLLLLTPAVYQSSLQDTSDQWSKLSRN